jgi:hypothetical protein
MANDKTHRYQTQVLWTFFQSQNRAVAGDAQTAKLAIVATRAKGVFSQFEHRFFQKEMTNDI